jgi:hypothetical protein
VWQLAGEGLRKPVENFALSAEQLQLVLHFSARQVDPALLLAVLRGYDQAEGRPPRKQVQRPIPQSRKPAPPVVIPEQTKAANPSAWAITTTHQMTPWDSEPTLILSTKQSCNAEETAERRAARTVAGRGHRGGDRAGPVCGRHAVCDAPERPRLACAQACL